MTSLPSQNTTRVPPAPARAPAAAAEALHRAVYTTRLYIQHVRAPTNRQRRRVLSGGRITPSQRNDLNMEVGFHTGTTLHHKVRAARPLRSALDFH